LRPVEAVAEFGAWNVGAGCLEITVLSEHARSKSAALDP
jgi:hypothetical protein